MDNVVKFPTKEEPKIERFFHCAKCMDELPEGVSPREYTNYEVGMTEWGIQVWCKRHETEVVELNLTDFWTTMKMIHSVRGLPEVPMIEITESEFPKTLIHSYSNGIYIDPNEYWHSTNGEPPEYKGPPLECSCCGE